MKSTSENWVDKEAIEKMLTLISFFVLPDKIRRIDGLSKG